MSNNDLESDMSDTEYDSEVDSEDSIYSASDSDMSDAEYEPEVDFQKSVSSSSDSATSDVRYDSGVDLPESSDSESDSKSVSRYPSPSLNSASQWGDKCTKAEWLRAVGFVGHYFSTMQWDRPEEERVLHRTGYGDEWVLGQPTPPAATLQNSLHPLFKRDRFIVDIEDPSVQDKLWDGLEPALQLASRMLGSPQVLRFFYKIHYGYEENLPGDKRFKKVVLYRDYHDRLGDHVIEDIQKLSTKLKFAFGAFKVESSIKHQIHAIHTVSAKQVHDYAYVRCKPSEILKIANENHYIIINEAYGHYFKHSDRRTTDRDQKVQWYLAKTLIHELAHAYYARDRACKYSDEHYNEPIIDPQHKVGNADGEEPELGRELDYALYGVYMHSIMHPTLGIFSEHHPYHFENGGYNINPCLVISPTCPVWITSWFREEKWKCLHQQWSEHAETLQDHEYTDFHVPTSLWAIVREKDDDDQPWMWTPRRSIMYDGQFQIISQNPKQGACVEDYEAKERAQVSALERCMVANF